MKFTCLNDRDMNTLFGEKYHGLLYYNYDVNMWNANNYCGIDIPYQEVDTARARALRIESEFNLTPNERRNRTLVAAVAMLTESPTLPMLGHFTREPKFNPDGHTIVGNLVMRNAATGRLTTSGAGWLIAADYKDHELAIQDGANAFLLQAIQHIKEFYR